MKLTREQIVQNLEWIKADGATDGAKRAALKEQAAAIQASLDAAAKDPALRALAVSALRGVQSFMGATGVLELSSLVALENACHEAGEEALEAECCLRTGIVAYLRLENGQAKSSLERGVELFSAQHNLQGQADCFYRLGDIARLDSSLKLAGEYFNQSLALQQRTGNAIGQAHATFGLGEVTHLQGHYAVAEATLRHAEELYKQADNHELGQANCAHTLALMALEQNQPDRALPFIERAEALFQNRGVQLGAAHCLKARADVKRLKGEVAGLDAEYEKAQALYLGMRDLPQASLCLLAQGDLAKAADPQQARMYYQRGLGMLVAAKEIKESTGTPHYEALLCEAMAEVDAQKPRWLGQAKMAWLKSERPDQVARIDQQLDELGAGRGAARG